jgi:hypothetical protein
MKSSWLLANFVFLSLGLAACGGNDSSVSPESASPAQVPSSAVDAAPSDHDAGDAGQTNRDGDAGQKDAAPDAPVVCNGPEDLATPVSIEEVPSAPPVPEGGVIADGTYVLTSAKKYTGPGGAAGPTGKTTSLTIRFAGTSADVFREGRARSSTYSLAGTQITNVQTCPCPATDTVGYTATPETFTAFIGSGPSLIVLTSTKL